MNYDFDRVIDRRGTSCVKYDLFMEHGLPEDTLAMWVADMDFETAPEIRAALSDAASHGIYGYTAQKDDYYDAVKGWFRRRFGWELHKKWIVLTPGVVFALAAAVRAYTKKGDAVLIQRPVYFPFTGVVEDNDRRVINSPLVRRDNRYYMNYEDMEKKIKDNQVKLFLMCSPHNPVSRVWTREELIRAAEICKRHGVIMVVDEIHCDFVLEGYRHVPFGTLSDYTDRMVICTAPSKTFNLAGLQLSNIIIPDEKLRVPFLDEMRRMAYHGPNMMGQIACRAAYEYGDEWLDELLVYLKGNADFLRDYLKEFLPTVQLAQPEGTYLLWLDFRGCGYDAETLKQKMLREAGIWMNEGAMFGEEGEGFMRINIACPRSILAEACERLRRVFGQK